MNCIWILLLLFCCGNNKCSGVNANNNSGCGCEHHHCNSCQNQKPFTYGNYPVLDNCDCN